MIPGSLLGQTLKPLCSDHKPVADVIPGPLVEIYCPNCGFRMTMRVEDYIEMMEEQNAKPE